MLDNLNEKEIKIIGYTFNGEISNNSEIKIINVKREKSKIILNDNIIQHNLLGEHNSRNIAIATVLALELGVNIKIIQDLLKNFFGSKRRIDLVFNNDKIKLYDDYAHHHTQIKCTIQAIKDNIVDSNNEKIIAILEPHLISRIKNNTKEFVDALLLADYPIVTKIFKSRESFMADIDVKSLLNNDRIDYIENYDDILNKIKEIIANNKDQKFDIVVMGAGNSYKITEQLKNYFISSRL